MLTASVFPFHTQHIHTYPTIREQTQRILCLHVEKIQCIHVKARVLSEILWSATDTTVIRLPNGNLSKSPVAWLEVMDLTDTAGEFFLFFWRVGNMRLF